MKDLMQRHAVLIAIALFVVAVAGYALATGNGDEVAAAPPPSYMSIPF